MSEELSQALILTQGKEPYFDDTARDFVSAINLHQIATKGPQATLAHMRKAITDIAARSKEAAELLVAMSNSPHAFVRQPIGRFKDAEARDISSAINTAITQTAFLDDPALSDPATGTLTGSDFDLMQLKRRPTTVYLILPGRYMDAYARFLRLIITSALDQLTAEPGGHPVLFILDEFARLEHLPAVSNAFGFAAGFNIQLWPFLQDMPQLEALYGKKWMSLLANCGLIQFFTPTDLQTAEYLQRRGGMWTGESRSRSFAGSFLKDAPERVPERSPDGASADGTVMSLPQEHSVVFFAGTHDPLVAGRKPYWEIRGLQGCSIRIPITHSAEWMVARSGRGRPPRP